MKRLLWNGSDSTLFGTNISKEALETLAGKEIRCVTCEFLPVGISILRLSKFGSTN